MFTHRPVRARCGIGDGYNGTVQRGESMGWFRVWVIMVPNGGGRVWGVGGRGDYGSVRVCGGMIWILSCAFWVWAVGGPSWYSGVTVWDGIGLVRSWYFTDL